MNTRQDFEEILKLVRPGARVLDIGCGEGALLELLAKEKDVDGRGLEISQANVAAALARGLSVVQGDADRELADYPDDAFDYAILSQTLQTVRDPRAVLNELLRIGRNAIVSFPNFGHWRVRLSLLVNGRMPTTKALPSSWWDTPNIHLCTLLDFTELAADLGFRIEAAVAMNSGKAPRALKGYGGWANLRAEQAIFLLTRAEPADAETPVRDQLF